MILGITYIDHNRISITSADRWTLLYLGEEKEGFEFYEFDGVRGLSVRTAEGLFNTDINSSGIYKLTKVENELGDIYNV